MLILIRSIPMLKFIVTEFIVNRKGNRLLQYFRRSAVIINLVAIFSLLRIDFIARLASPISNIATIFVVFTL